LTLNNQQIRWLKLVAWILCLVPLLNVLWKVVHILPWTQDIGFIAAGADRWNLGANPINVIERAMGKATLIMILVTLAVTPARRVLRQPWLIRFRRLFGLFAFFYATLHLLSYVVLDQFFDYHSMISDIAKRKYITVGLAAFVLLIPLAVTSTSGWIRRLGGKRWARLHQLIYATAVLAIFHFLWLVKFDTRRPIKYGAVLALLFAYRIAVWMVERAKARSRAVTASSQSAATQS
jgi:sulfoxide reductase heme-binding subunit YedZ